jgi:glycosyltransferase involved in cell wall biosynthesis
LFKDHRKARDGRTGANPPIIWDSVDCISHLFKQAVKQNSNPLSLLPLRFDLKRTQRYESYLLDQFDRTLVTSAIDKDALRSLYTGKENPNICVVPNGVDLDYFCLERHLQRSPVSLVATGKMSYHANIRMVLHLVHEIMPIVWASRPDVALVVAGKDPPREIRDLAANQSIQVTGTVPDIRPYLHRATMAVSPLVYGAGIQNKVLEAMACGTPVITTSRAISALSVVPGQDVLVADTPESFAEAILRLFGDPIRQELLSQAGRKYVEEYHNWDNIAMQLENIYCAAIDHKEVYEDDGSRTIHPDLQ